MYLCHNTEYSIPIAFIALCFVNLSDIITQVIKHNLLLKIQYQVFVRIHTYVQLIITTAVETLEKIYL